jgi:hypothetical protein
VRGSVDVRDPPILQRHVKAAGVRAIERARGIDDVLSSEWDCLHAS